MVTVRCKSPSPVQGLGNLILGFLNVEMWISSRVGHVLYAYSIIVSRGSAWTGVNIAQSEFGSVVTKALEAQNDYGNKLQSSQSDPDPIRFRAQVSKGYDSEAKGYLSLQVDDIVYLRNLDMYPGVPSARYKQYMYGYTKDLSASGSDPLLASGWFPLDVVTVKEHCFEFDLSTDCYGEKKEVTFS